MIWYNALHFPRKFSQNFQKCEIKKYILNFMKIKIDVYLYSTSSYYYYGLASIIK